VSATSHGVGAGIVLGVVFVLLAQQFGYVDLNPLVAALIDILIAAVVGGILFGIIGWALGRRYEKNHPEQFGSGTPPS
jgi:multisubunit Na+/H+ antiporter MnhB subunit